MVSFFIPSKIEDSMFCGLAVNGSMKSRRQRQLKRRWKIYKFSLLVLFRENGAFCFARGFIVDFEGRGAQGGGGGYLGINVTGGIRRSLIFCT